MVYDISLPSIRSLKRLADWNGPFPIKSYRMVLGAKHFGFDEDTIIFLKLFPHDEIFQNRADFLQRCHDLELLLRAEREMPAEVLRSPQG